MAPLRKECELKYFGGRPSRLQVALIWSLTARPVRAILTPAGVRTLMRSSVLLAPLLAMNMANSQLLRLFMGLTTDQLGSYDPLPRGARTLNSAFLDVPN